MSGTLWPHELYPPCSCVHGILQARILEWVVIPFSRGSSWPRDQTPVSCIAGGFFTIWAPREATVMGLVISDLIFKTEDVLTLAVVYQNCKDTERISMAPSQGWHKFMKRSIFFCDDLKAWDGGGGREIQEGGDIRILMADSHCMAEASTTL